MSVRVRFAPSPTGKLHVGNARTALVNWLFARAVKGTFILRFDDTDAQRSEARYADSIRDDLLWLGLSWNENEYHQSARLSLYAQAAEKLEKAGRLYPCYETVEELDLQRKVQLARHQPPVYNRAALRLSDADKQRLEAEGRKPHWRFRLEHRKVEWNDRIRGHAAIDAASLSDPVLIRADGVPLYTLSSVVDDVDLHVTHVIRGEDHVTNTVSQIQIFEALGAKAPEFAHLALLVGREGEGLSKRIGSLSLESLRDEGIEAMAVNSLLARLGSAKPIEPFRSLEALDAGFNLHDFGRAPARFDPAELRALSSAVLHRYEFSDVEHRLTALGLTGTTPEFWLAIRGNLERLTDARDWWSVTAGAIAPVIDDPGFATTAASLLPEEPWDESTWTMWTSAVRAATGRKGKELYMPLRRALTAREQGPELKALLPMIGRVRAAARLSGKEA
ncbi:MAG: glutamate--tRNA ligase [Alphaproteobacteria bacterium]|nr:glutamate--tRNA ligase [Alphaproteobacteria bacterium]